METEYADVFPPRSYANLGYWYVEGYFLCSLEGSLPEEPLIIY